LTITDLFKKLNAPLANSRWAWGSVRATDGAVVLRVWQDRKIKNDDRHFMMITHHEKFVGKEENLGYKERNEHAGLIRNGRKCYMVMCLAEDVEASPRTIKSFNFKDVFVGGEVIELNGNTWVELAGRIPVNQAIA